MLRGEDGIHFGMKASGRYTEVHLHYGEMSRNGEICILITVEKEYTVPKRLMGSSKQNRTWS